jgi:cyclic pyranopterin monophosphate synthase
MSALSHIDANGNAQMVDVGGKASTDRQASAQGCISMSAAAIDAVRTGLIKKGDVLNVARIAGIMAAKKTSDIIPLCHPLMLTNIQIDFDVRDDAIWVHSSAGLQGQTGVEMEALTAASVALLTIYDMVKAIDKSMVISGIELTHKSGGKSGDWSKTP